MNDTIEEIWKEFNKKFPNYMRYSIEKTIEIIREETREKVSKNIGMLRQWLNEDRITDPAKMVTNEMIEQWLINNNKEKE